MLETQAVKSEDWDALSVQCLDDNHANWRQHESKPEFLYSEDQRLALEALIQGGRHAFQEYIQEHSVRPFLSELEQDQLTGAAEVYQPGCESSEGEGLVESEDVAGSLHYWPERSDDSIPELDMGWPDCLSYRGVTRVNVYTQPPMDGQMHIKEVVRKTIAQAQKVIAVVMDLFTDVDIFKDLLEASFKRKVAVYIILEATGVPHFLSMCGRTTMHTGHVKKLRVRCAGGTEFRTRSLRKVCGLLSQKFMFVDGDRALSGSYSYTWTASRLDRNLITVVTGQTVETFDRQFRDLYLMSRSVSLGKISLEAEPHPELAPHLVAPLVLSAAMARKLINPKYALVTCNIVEPDSGVSSEKSAARNAHDAIPIATVPQRLREAAAMPPIHPGLLDLERANLIHYLPTWPEPDPPSDVIGFINIRDSNKPTQAHLMRSEQFETSQAIRFRDPFITPQETLPDKAYPSSKSSEDAQSAKKEAKEDSKVSTMSGEYHKSTEPVMSGTEHTRSGHTEVQRHPDELNPKVRVSQPTAEQKPQNQPHNQQEPRVIQTCPERKQMQTDGQVHADSRKLNQTSSRMVSNIHTQQEGQGRSMAKVPAGTPNGCFCPVRQTGPDTGAHMFWHGTQLAQSRPGQGCPPMSHDKSCSIQSSFHSRPAQMRPANQAGRLPYRHSQAQPPQSQLGRSRASHQGSPGHRLPAPQEDSRTPFGLPFARLSQFNTLNGKMSVGPLGNLQRTTTLGNKGAI